MKKLPVIVCLLVVLSLTLGVISCGQASSPATTAPAKTAATATTAAPTTTAPAPATATSKPAVTTAPPATTSVPTTAAAATTSGPKYTLSLAPISCVAPPPDGSNPPPSGSSLFFANFVKLAATKTNGQVKIDPYWSQTLSPANQVVANTSSGVADIGGIAQDKEPGKLPLSMVAEEPGFGTDWWAMSMAFFDLTNQDPLLSEYAKYNLVPLGVNFVSDYYLISTKPIRTVADLKGKRISSVGIQAQTLTALGAVPVAMSPQEQYEGMQKGTIDGNLAGYSPICDFKFYEVAKNITTFPFGGKMQLILMNKNSWNKLPPDIQAIFKAMVPDEVQINVDAFYRQGQITFPMSDQLAKDNGIQIIKPGPDDVAALKKIQAIQADSWAADTDKAGMPGSKLLADYRALIAKYEKVSTFAFK